MPSLDFTSLLQNTLLQSLTTVFANALNSTPQSTTTNNNELVEKLTQAINTTTAQSTNAVETVLEYRPTPLAELERRRRVQQHTVKPNNKNSKILLII